MGARLLWATLINFIFTIVQIVGGLLANSLSLLSDALHNLADSAAIFLAFIANRISKRKPDARNSFGYARFEIIAALLNAVVLCAVCLFLFVEAYKRFLSPEPVRGGLMLVVALFGLLANVVSAIILHHDRKNNLNVKAAYLHLMGDTLSSVAVLAGGLAMWLFEIYWIDPLVTVLVGLLILWHAWGIVQESVAILMQATPSRLSREEVMRRIVGEPEVCGVHHLHLWQLNDSQVHCEAHVQVAEDLPLSRVALLQARVEQCLKEEFGIGHVTLQFEYGACVSHSDAPCAH